MDLVTLPHFIVLFCTLVAFTLHSTGGNNNYKEGRSVNVYIVCVGTLYFYIYIVIHKQVVYVIVSRIMDGKNGFITIPILFFLFFLCCVHNQLMPQFQVHNSHHLVTELFCSCVVVVVDDLLRLFTGMQIAVLI